MINTCWEASRAERAPSISSPRSRKVCFSSSRIFLSFSCTVITRSFITVANSANIDKQFILLPAAGLARSGHNPLVRSQHLGNPGRREGGGCKAERGIAPERTGEVREDASPKRQRSKRPLSTDQGRVSWLDSHKGMVEIFVLVKEKDHQPFP